MSSRSGSGQSLSGSSRSAIPGHTIHPVPIGGFVKLAAMEPGEEDVPNGFQAQSAGKRALIIFAGPLFSLLLAAIAFVALGVYWGFPDAPKMQNRIAMVYPQTEAQAIDLRTGDRNSRHRQYQDHAGPANG